MPSELFDPLLELTLDVARKEAKAKPPTVPARLAAMVKFAKVPPRAKDTVLDVLDADDAFRSRVQAKATELTVGRLGMSFLEREEGWEVFVEKMVGAASEHVVEPTKPLRQLEKRLEAAERARERSERALVESQSGADDVRAELVQLRSTHTTSASRVAQLESENAKLVEERRRAVSELKRTEDVLARHVAERKKLEVELEAMTRLHESTTTVGGGITDERVRQAVAEAQQHLTAAVAELDQLAADATPTRVAAARRVALGTPHGLFEDSAEVADYILGVSGMVVLVDGYNVTKEAHGEWSLERQREWLEQGLLNLAARCQATFDVVFDGAGLGDAAQRRARDRGVRVRFSPQGVEADDVILASVDAVSTERPVAVVSSDRRVRDGARARGADVLFSHQLIGSLG